MKILIVDDEKIIRRGMVQNIPWRKLGLEPPLEARNGADALAIFERERPDILLTDIRMPLMDGVELSSKVRELSAETQIIYMTGYQDMEYIKAAFKQGAVDYILKPVEYDELLRTLERAVRQCSEDMGLRKLKYYLQQRLERSAPFYTRKLLKDLVEGRFEQPQELLRKLRFWGVDLSPDRSYAALAVRIADYRHADAENRQALVLGVEDLLQDLLDEGAGGYAFHLQDGQFACLLDHNSDETGTPRALMTAAKQALAAYLAGPVDCAMGPPVMGLFNLCESHQSALEQLRTVGELDKQDPPVDGQALNTRLIEQLADRIRARDEPGCSAASAALIDAARQSGSVSVDHLRGLYLMALGGLTSSVAGGELGREAVDVYTHCSGKLALCESEEALHDRATELLDELCSVLQREPDSPGARIADEIRAIVDERFAENLTIRDLSRRIFLTPQYLCQVFKLQTGITINDYITQRRVERAKQLLRSGDYKLYEIAPMVGYLDAKYFSRVFKRLTGVSPSDY